MLEQGLDDIAKLNSFESLSEMFGLIAKVKLDNAEDYNAFKKWRTFDGSKAGLLQLIERQKNKDSRNDSKMLKYPHTRKIEPRMTRGEFGDYVEYEVGMVYDEGYDRPAKKEEIPTGWAVWDSVYGWIVDPRSE